MIKPCVKCGASFESQSPRAMFCGKKCRQNASLDRKRNLPLAPRLASAAVSAEGVDSPPATVSTVDAVRQQLAAAGRAETYLGSSALALARRIDESTAVMGFAALVKELRSTMDAAMAGVQVADDPIDELRARRDSKRVG